MRRLRFAGQLAKLTYGSRHGEHAENSSALPVDNAAAGSLDPAELIRPVWLQEPERREKDSVADTENLICRGCYDFLWFIVTL